MQMQEEADLMEESLHKPLQKTNQSLNALWPKPRELPQRARWPCQPGTTQPGGREMRTHWNCYNKTLAQKKHLDRVVAESDWQIWENHLEISLKESSILCTGFYTWLTSDVFVYRLPIMMSFVMCTIVYVWCGLVTSPCAPPGESGIWGRD